jgi:hypothetical protein
LPTYATERRCPYCGTLLLLADCPIVATNYAGVEFRGSKDITIDDIELPSRAKPVSLDSR